MAQVCLHCGAEPEEGCVPRNVQSLVDELSQLLSLPATLEDHNFNLVAFCSQNDEIDAVRQHTILQRSSSAQVRAWFEQFGIVTADQPVRTPADVEHGTVARLCLPARWRRVNYGYFWVLDEHGQVGEHLLPTAMAVAAEAGAALAHQSRTRQDLELQLQSLLSADADLVEDAAAEVNELGVIPRHTPVVALVCELGLESSPPEPINTWELPRSVLVTSTGHDSVSAVVPLTDAVDLAPAIDVGHRIRELLVERIGTLPDGAGAIGIGSPRGDLGQVRASWLQARLAATIARTFPEHYPLAHWSGLGVHRLLACGPRSSLATAVIDPAVSRLLADASADLVLTARTYLDHAGNVARTARVLQIHRQTLYYRMQRIEQIAGLDLSRGADRLVLHLGLTLSPALRG